MTTGRQELDATLEIGLRWLYRTEQPAGAVLQHHGMPLPATGNRKLRFCPAGANGRPVVVINVVNVEWGDPGQGPANPLAAGELEALAAAIAHTGTPVAQTWNGHPGITGSVGLAHRAHPTLRAAVDRYRAGCPQHHTVFCSRQGCSWYRDGNAKARYPRDLIGG